jgi:hypothetical protein
MIICHMSGLQPHVFMSHDVQSRIALDTSILFLSYKLLIYTNRYHVRGALIAQHLSPGDIGLVQKYAEVQVTSFAANLESAVQAAAVSLAYYSHIFFIWALLAYLYRSCAFCESVSSLLSICPSFVIISWFLPLAFVLCRFRHVS